jgi:hypothetical protein
MALRYRASAAMAKGVTMGAFGLWVVGTVVWHTLHGTLPNALRWARSASLRSLPTPLLSVCSGRSVMVTPTCVQHGFALATTCSAIWRYYSRLLACSAQAPAGPDVIVAAIMAGLAMQGATTVIRQSLDELRQPASVPAE